MKRSHIYRGMLAAVVAAGAVGVGVAGSASGATNWSNVASFNPTSSTFGKVTSKTGLARNLQLSLRFYF